MKKGLWLVLVVLCVPVFPLMGKQTILIPEIKTNRSCGFITFWSVGKKEVLRRILQKQKDCGLAKAEMKLLAKLIMKGFYVREQTRAEYEKFRVEAAEAPAACRRYVDLRFFDLQRKLGSKVGNWTAYRDLRKYYNPKTGDCRVPKI